ncbi:aminotransferase class V-fold PLP-dependent enzyme [Frankia sp. CNm7]|uniref:Probable hercynylcysteine sulfoxide lyase n=1 Tax=Frankia nepalensis TaxID=1836974 RepID=A0A937USE6_9ACTN|nr:aminotransferase class V-fold PLP-dependent enzyme [Frankia nepalensis]MBL7496409.1 aminotransferase class V-fold PLP-dependent enzyme [Frankia nepalensis]MBL7513779.1 aminotransferase class V-fold PLP-dependent enzyme [Frankia nepalensis]MBL7518641.1 aminotransferase class V-fold PLP-dependent enzyme [Frankia nepalensis]MBL7630195.1 aminotransferase class V-fold PLP-dependent enzyme [Frankia nepalensis]
MADAVEHLEKAGPCDDAAAPAPPASRQPSPGGSQPPAEELGARWRAARAGLAVVHLDAAAAGAASGAVVDAQVAHLAAEARLGSYAAQELAAERLDAARAALAGLLGPALTGADVAFHHSATSAFAALVGAWPLPPGGRVGIVPSDFSSNLLTLRARAARDGLELVDLPLLPDGRVDVDRLGRGEGPAALDRLDLVTFPEVPSQRGVVQPTAAVATLCRDAGVPLLLDAAQSLGQVDVAAGGATGGVTACVGTSRKWLCGPRGVGFLAVRPDFVERLGVPAPTGYTARWEPDPAAAGGGRLVAFEGVGRFDVGEAAMAARVGLAAALAEHVEAGPEAVRARVQALAAAARRRLDGVAGWRLGEDVASPCGIVTLTPPAGVDPAVARERLRRESGILTSAIDRTRARDAVPALRVSPHVHSTLADLDRLAEALDRATR